MNVSGFMYPKVLAAVLGLEWYSRATEGVNDKLSHSPIGWRSGPQDRAGQTARAEASGRTQLNFQA